MDIINRAHGITNALKLYMNDAPAAPPWLDIIRARNAFQHQLLALPAFGGFIGREDSVYDACRLAACIYSDMVIFPLPSVAGVKRKLAARLRQTLDCCTAHRCWEINATVMLWIATLGGIAASNTSHRAWYLGKISLCLDFLGIVDCAGYLRSITPFLWWDLVCEDPLRRLWEDLTARGLVEAVASVTLAPG